MRIHDRGARSMKRSSSSTSCRGSCCPLLPRFRKVHPQPPHPQPAPVGTRARHVTPLRAVGYGQPVPGYRYQTLASDDGPDDELLPTLGWRQDLADVIDVGKLIGAGSFGQVRLGTVRSRGEKVAVKTMAKVRGKLSSADTLVKICKEVDMLRLVQGCPGAIRLLGCFEDMCSVHVVTELCQGGDLKRYVEEYGPLPEEALVIVTLEVLKFLKACHDRGIVYADVKPANFCLKDNRPFDSNGSSNPNPSPSPSVSSNGSSSPPVTSCLKAIDMGSSHVVRGAERLRKRHGTLVYMAPEVLRGDYTFKADMWSVGITLYWLFTQAFPYWPAGFEPPLVRMDIMEQLAEALDLDLTRQPCPKPWTQLSLEGRDFISRCLRVDEAQRMSVEEALQHPWVKEMAAAEACAGGAQCRVPIAQGGAHAPLPVFATGQTSSVSI